jgi:hypothetical protein
MRWRRRGADPVGPDASSDRDPERVEIHVTTTTGPYPVCSQCGRDSLPIVGGWDPPICEDCDAAINEDAMWSEEVDS